MNPTSESPNLISGKKFLVASGTTILAAAVVGTGSYFLLKPILGSGGGTTAQVVAFLVYLTLVLGFCWQFRPAMQPPIALRPSGLKHAIASVGIWIGTLAIIVLFYYCLGWVFGSVPSAMKQIIAFATDAKRLQGQAPAAWAVAIVRGCLLVPIFEEVVFRGLLLSWLRKHLKEDLAIVIMAALFALEHGSFIVGPCVFLFAVAAGYVRLRTGSTFNTVIMHSLNNVLFLLIGLRLFNVH